MRTNKLGKTVLAIFISLYFSANVFADDQQDESNTDQVQTSGDVYAGGKEFQGQKSQGWFWKKDPPPAEKEVKAPPPKPKPEEKKDQEKKPVVSAPPAASAGKTDEPPAFSVAWFRENIQKLRDRAIDNPTQENVRAYLLAQRIMLDKASRYKDMAQIVSITDPLIDETGRRSTSSFGSLSQSVTADANQKRVSKIIASKAGIFFFFKGQDCSLCVQQAAIMQSLKYLTTIDIIPITMDGQNLPGNPFPNVKVDSGQAEKLQIKNFPAVALAIPPSDTRIISFGPLSADQLVKRIILIAHDAGLVSDDDYKSTLPFNDNGYIDSNTLKDMPENYLKDPDKFIKFIQTKAGYSPTNDSNESSSPSATPSDRHSEDSGVTSTENIDDLTN